MVYRMSIPKEVAARQQQAQKVERVERGKVEEERQLPRPVGPVRIQTIWAVGIAINALISILELQHHARCATMAGEIHPLPCARWFSHDRNPFEAKRKTKKAWRKS